jgi:hypothetical protein
MAAWLGGAALRRPILIATGAMIAAGLIAVGVNAALF